MISVKNFLTTALCAMPLLFLDTVDAANKQTKVKGRESSSSRCEKGPKGDRGERGERGRRGRQGPQGDTGLIANIADFFALMPPDNATTVAAGGAVAFPQNGPVAGTVITRFDASTFNLAAVGTYQVLFEVSVTEAGQLVVALDSGSGPVEQGYTVVGRATGTSQIVGMSLITTTVPNTRLTIRNPTGESTALTITPLAGGTDPVSAHVIITQVA